jgi:hypothetical protein
VPPLWLCGLWVENKQVHAGLPSEDARRQRGD